jgi:hypothetical protein
LREKKKRAISSYIYDIYHLPVILYSRGLAEEFRVIKNTADALAIAIIVL